MNKEQLQQMRQAPGFVGALDQSGGSTPKALKAYGIQPDAYQSEEEMFDLIHQMRTRMITSPAFATGKIIGVILFERTMRGKIEGMPTADFLWEKRHIVPFLKVDKGLQDEANGVQLMKPFPELGKLCEEAVGYHVFGTKMRSVIKQANEQAVKNAVRNKILFDGVSSASGLRTDIALFLADHGRMPNSLNEIGWAGGVTSVNLSAIEMRSGGILALSFNPEKLRGTIILTPKTNIEAGMITDWDCTSPDIDFIAEALPECRYQR